MMIEQSDIIKYVLLHLCWRGGGGDLENLIVVLSTTASLNGAGVKLPLKASCEKEGRGTEWHSSSLSRIEVDSVCF